MSVVIIGAGHAGTTAAAALRKLDKDIKISLVSEEGSPPYQRPPLSKKTIFSVTQNYDLILGKDFYNKNNIQLNLNSAVEEINPAQSHVRLNSNKIIEKSRKNVLPAAARSTFFQLLQEHLYKSATIRTTINDF